MKTGNGVTTPLGNTLHYALPSHVGRHKSMPISRNGASNGCLRSYLWRNIHSLFNAFNPKHIDYIINSEKF